MNFFVGNFSWMFFNVCLATIPVLLVIALRRKTNFIIHLILLGLWFLFLPNTIYLLTDLQYLPYQIMRAGMTEQALLFVSYTLIAILGIMSYLYALEPVKLIVKKLKLSDGSNNGLYVFLNFIVSFGVVLGKTQRTHSWYVFTDLPRVVRDIKATVSSPNLLIGVLLFGIVINVFFFLFRKYFIPFKTKKKGRKK